MSIKFITNTEDDHYTYINELIGGTDETWMAVAFLKNSGLNLIREKLTEHINNGRLLNMIVGLNFATTDPSALKSLLDLFEGKENAKLYLAKIESLSKVFHPKLYVFKKDADISILSGSANLTAGGISSNVECSLLLKTTINDKVAIDTQEFLNKLISEEYSNLATIELIEEYAKYYSEQEVSRKNLSAKPKKDIINYNNISFWRVFLGKSGNKKFPLICHSHDFIGIDYQVHRDLKDDLKLTKVDFIKKYDSIIKEVAPSKNPKITAGILWQFGNSLKEGDIVLSPNNDGSYFIGYIDGSYYFETQKEVSILPHRKKVKWILKISENSVSNELSGSISYRRTIKDINEHSKELIELISNQHEL